MGIDLLSQSYVINIQSLCPSTALLSSEKLLDNESPATKQICVPEEIWFYPCGWALTSRAVGSEPSPGSQPEHTWTTGTEKPSEWPCHGHTVTFYLRAAHAAALCQGWDPAQGSLRAEPWPHVQLTPCLSHPLALAALQGGCGVKYSCLALLLGHSWGTEVWLMPMHWGSSCSSVNVC